MVSSSAILLIQNILNFSKSLNDGREEAWNGFLVLFVPRRSSCGGKAMSQGRTCPTKQPLPPSATPTPVSPKRSQTQRTDLKMGGRVSHFLFSFCVHLTCWVKYRRPSLEDSLTIIYFEDVCLKVRMWRFWGGGSTFKKGFAGNVSWTETAVDFTVLFSFAILENIVKICIHYYTAINFFMYKIDFWYFVHFIRSKLQKQIINKVNIHYIKKNILIHSDAVVEK